MSKTSVCHTAHDQKVDRKLDILGHVCPYTFVRSKLALETMNVGEILEIVTDHVPALNDIPKNMENEGQQVLKIEQGPGNVWHIFVKKAV